MKNDENRSGDRAGFWKGTNQIEGSSNKWTSSRLGFKKRSNHVHAVIHEGEEAEVKEEIVGEHEEVDEGDLGPDLLEQQMLPGDGPK